MAASEPDPTVADESGGPEIVRPETVRPETDRPSAFAFPEALNGLSASVALRRLAEEIGPQRVTLDHILARLGDRAFGIILIILAAPNCLPMPPGVSAIFGTAIMLIASQVLFGRHRLWVPAVFRRRSVARSDFKKVVGWFAPILQRIEALCRPRVTWITAGPAERVIGFIAFVLGFVVALPVPIIGQVPPAIVIGILSVSLIERDGLVVLLGVVLAVIVVALNFGAIAATVIAVIAAIRNVIGSGVM